MEILIQAASELSAAEQRQLREALVWITLSGEPREQAEAGRWFVTLKTRALTLSVLVRPVEAGEDEES
jgi:hypothetical protein